jgi:hypothetical protein
MSRINLMIVDANTIWHQQISNSLGELTPTIAFKPYAGLVKRHVGEIWKSSSLNIEPVALFPGWASKTSSVGQRQLARGIQKASKRFAEPPTVILTSPKYLPLARYLGGAFPLVYYCADDYREYRGWGGARMADAERDVLTRTVLSVFVSDALRERAIKEYGVPRANTLVSPNATEQRFIAQGVRSRPPGLELAQRPIVGVLGGVSDRLDVALITSVAQMEQVGTFLIAGPVDPDLPYASRLHESKKVHIVGEVDHRQMHQYALAMDVALIPYANTALNYFCSPLRLFDHLVSGAIIVSTDACDQINKLDHPRLTVSAPSGLRAKVAEALQAARELPSIRPSDASEFLWSNRAARIIGALS